MFLFGKILPGRMWENFGTGERCGDSIFALKPNDSCDLLVDLGVETCVIICSGHGKHIKEKRSILFFSSRIQSTGRCTGCLRNKTRLPRSHHLVATAKHSNLGTVLNDLDLLSAIVKHSDSLSNGKIMST